MCDISCFYADPAIPTDKGKRKQDKLNTNSGYMNLISGNL